MLERVILTESDEGSSEESTSPREISKAKPQPKTPTSDTLPKNTAKSKYFNF